MTAVAVRRHELVMVPWPAKWHRLPRISDRIKTSRCVTAIGYHRGRKPGNFGRTYPAEILTAVEVRSLIAATGGGYAGSRDRALYTLLYRSGLRISEALALMPKDVDLEQGRATVLHGKNDKRRVSTRSSHGSTGARSLASGASSQCSVSSPSRLSASGSTRPVSVSSCATAPDVRGSRSASTRTACATASPQSLLLRACRSTSSAGCSDTQTARRPRGTSTT